jgi:hypothetical protein
MLRTNIAILTALLLPAVAEGASAPPALYGKSVVVSWSEERVQRPLGAEEVRHISVNLELSAYISANGRIFNRLAATSIGNARAGKMGTRSGGSDQGGGTQDASKLAQRTAHFEGNSLLVENKFGAGGARRIAVNFDGGYSGCTAQVINGRSAGATVTRQRSLVTRQPIEVLSVSTGSASCSIKAGNVFGE